MSVNMSEQYTTFKVGKSFFGVPVSEVQEVILGRSMTEVPLAPSYVRGLINLRGRVATAVHLGDFLNFGIETNEDSLNILCQFQESLVAFMISEIGDVITIDSTKIEKTPASVPKEVADYSNGVYRSGSDLVIVLNFKRIYEQINFVGDM